MFPETMAWWLKRVRSIVLCFAALAAVHPVRAALIVSDLGLISDRRLREFDDKGNLLTVVSGGTGGIAVLTTGGVSEVFVANGTSVISVYSPENLAFLRSFTVAGTSGITALSLSPDGLLLYGADPVTQTIFALDTAQLTGTVRPRFSVFPAAPNDIVVGPDGSVYAASYARGVLKFSAGLTTPIPFVAAGDHGLGAATGMMFDRSGNFFVSNFGSDATTAFINEYGADGTFIAQIATNPFPFGLTQGPPGDDSIYVAESGGSNTVGKITGGVRSNFIESPLAGFNPVYLQFTENSVTAVPEPGALSLLLFGLVTVGLAPRFVQNERKDAIHPLISRRISRSRRNAGLIGADDSR